MFPSVMTSYPNPPMLEAAVPSPNTLLVEEVIALLKAGLWPNDAVEPNPGEVPKAGGLPNTGALPNPPVKKQRLSFLSLLTTAEFSAQTPVVLRVVPSWVRIVPTRFPFKDKITFIKSARLPGGKQQTTPTLEPTLSTGLRSKRGREEKMH